MSPSQTDGGGYVGVKRDDGHAVGDDSEHAVRSARGFTATIP